MQRLAVTRAQVRRTNFYCTTALVLVLLSSPALATAQPTTQSAETILDIPSQPLGSALQSFSVQTGSQVMFSPDAVAGRDAPPVKGRYSPEQALAILIKGSGLTVEHSSDRVYLVKSSAEAPVKLAQATKKPASPTPQQSSLETVVVTAQKKTENIQTVPIAVTALSQQQLTERQIAGGPDLVKEVPNLTFSKTNFTGYNLEIRGIGTQAISVTTDPAVAVALNDTPFIRNHFFEQEFYDLDDVEVLRGPQGTLYGRNATAGVVNLKSALPTDQYEAMLSADIGNYSNRRYEAMLNLPIVGDTLDLRIAGEWTKRDGYSFNSITDQSIDGRDLWSGRVTLGWKPTSDVQAYLVWEHFSEDDDRLRSGKQLCKTAQPPASINGVPVPPGNLNIYGQIFTLNADYMSQGCEDTSLYSPDAFEVPYGFSLPYAIALGVAGAAAPGVDPYASTTQSQNLRVIESALDPHYRAKNDTLELNADYSVTPALTFVSQTGYNQDFLWSTEDYNRFNTSPGIFSGDGIAFNGGINYPSGYFFPDPAAGTDGIPSDSHIFCDPQLGCSDRLVAEDLSEEHAWQLSQEFRLASNFSGPFNFSIGGNYLHYETEENYYVFVNALSAFSVITGDSYGTNLSRDHSDCLHGTGRSIGYQNPNPIGGGGEPTDDCVYIDTNPISSLNNKGHNYFLSQNPYELNSYAGFGEAYYNIADDLKLTGGLRWTEDRKRFVDIPSEVIDQGYGYDVTGVENQQWDQLTGRTAVNWTPNLDFTDQTLVYGSYAHGYKAGGANPPGAVFGTYNLSNVAEPVHPLTFKPEFIDSYELGSKNTMLDGALTLNGDVFYYNYKDYQISEIVDRTSINQNFNATVKGAELETSWEPAPGLKFSFAGGYEDTRIDNGQSAIDLMDRTAGMPGWMVFKPFPTAASNCILPTYVVQALLELPYLEGGGSFACSVAYTQLKDPVTFEPYMANPQEGGIGGGLNNNYSPITPYTIPSGYPGFNPAQPAINDGEGFAKNLGGNQLPNAPHFTTSLTAEYTMPVSDDWAATFHTDFYWQSQQWARVFEDPIDKIHGYSNVNLSLILTSANGWQVMGYVKNVFDVTSITGTFLNSDDSGLTTNVFLTDPRLYGIRVTKHLDEGDGFWGSSWSGFDLFTDLFADKDGGKPPLWIELGGQMDHVGGQGAVFTPDFLAANPTSSVLWDGTTPTQAQQHAFSFGEEAKISYQPDDSDWIFSAAIRYGRSTNAKEIDHQTNELHYIYHRAGYVGGLLTLANFADTHVRSQSSQAVLDFSAGKDVGLGMLGDGTLSTLNLGVRIAQFASKEAFDIRARPDFHQQYFSYGYYGSKIGLPSFHAYHAAGQSSRSFHGIGPSLSWNGSAPLVGDLQNGEVTMDWGANAALLFGRQSARVRHQETGYHRTAVGLLDGQFYPLMYQNSPRGHDTFRTVAVPNFGGFAGISWRYKNAKVSFGYRADLFFGAIDGGIDERHSETLNMGGPFATISFGLGG